MGQPLPLRPDYDAPALRALARRVVSRVVV